jgi:hypothetical protein
MTEAERENIKWETVFIINLDAFTDNWELGTHLKEIKSVTDTHRKPRKNGFIGRVDTASHTRKGYYFLKDLYSEDIGLFHYREMEFYDELLVKDRDRTGKVHANIIDWFNE